MKVARKLGVPDLHQRIADPPRHHDLTHAERPIRVAELAPLAVHDDVLLDVETRIGRGVVIPVADEIGDVEGDRVARADIGAVLGVDAVLARLVADLPVSDLSGECWLGAGHVVDGDGQAIRRAAGVSLNAITGHQLAIEAVDSDSRAGAVADAQSVRIAVWITGRVISAQTDTGSNVLHCERPARRKILHVDAVVGVILHPHIPQSDIRRVSPTQPSTYRVATVKKDVLNDVVLALDVDLPDAWTVVGRGIASAARRAGAVAGDGDIRLGTDNALRSPFSAALEVQRAVRSGKRHPLRAGRNGLCLRSRIAVIARLGDVDRLTFDGHAGMRDNRRRVADDDLRLSRAENGSQQKDGKTVHCDPRQ